MSAELPFERVQQVGTIWFAPRCCVMARGDRRDVYAGGVFLGGFSRGEEAQRNVLLVALGQQPDVHLGDMARAFGLRPNAVRVIRRLYEERGLDAVIGRQHGGARMEVGPGVVRRLEKMFDRGLSVTEAFTAIGRGGKSRSTVGRVRQAWAAKKGSGIPPLTAVPEAVGQSVPIADTAAARHGPRPEATLAVPESEFEDDGNELTTLQPASASGVQHLGAWLLIAAVHSLGLHARARAVSGSRVAGDALRLALDAVVAALAIGERCVEGVRRLATGTASSLLLASSAPSTTWMRRAIGRLSDGNGGALLQVMMAGVYLARAKEEAGAEGPVFYIDNHMRPYMGKHVLRHGWRMQDKRALPGVSDYYVHDEDGRVIRHYVVPEHGSLTDVLTPVGQHLREALGPEENILLAFDRAGSFPEQMAELRDESFEFVTYERRPYAALSESEFTETVVIEGERYGLHESRANLGGGRGRVRRISVRAPDGYQVNLLAISRRPALRLLEVMRGRWRQENGFKHANERWGINQLDGRVVEPYPEEAVIPNPARRRLENALELARVREGLARNALARMAKDDVRRAHEDAELTAAMDEQQKLLALRPSLPTHAPLKNTELTGKLVKHKVGYKLALDTIRAACINAEADLALLLAPHLPRPTEAKKVLANLFASPGDVRVTSRQITVTLKPAATASERRAIDSFLSGINSAHLALPGDQRSRPLRFHQASFA